MHYRNPPPWSCRIRRALGRRKCYFKHVGIMDEQGIYRCHCGAERLGLKHPIVIQPGETVAIEARADL